LRSRRNWGHGDFTDLQRLIAVAAAQGAAAVALNPLHALFPDRAEQASPYAPNSRLFLNVLYIDVAAIPEFDGGMIAEFRHDVATLAQTAMIDYPRVAHIKVTGLRLAYENFRKSASEQRRTEFEAFRREQDTALLCFGCFEALRRQFAPKPWQQWPEPWRRPDRAILEEYRKKHLDECEFHEFCQWIADGQLKTCQDMAHAHGMPIGLYVDLAVGIDPNGADAWFGQDEILTDMSIGAPPDEFNPAGQNWGLAPFNPHALVASDFAAMRALMAATMRHCGAIRLDHVLGFNRIFMIPHGMSPTDGVYVRFPFEALLRILAEESNRYRCILIGEDLGTVPDGFRETLARRGMWTYRVMLFERGGDGRFHAPESYPAEALATFNTHDLPSFRGWIEAYDLAIKKKIGIDSGETERARRKAQDDLRVALSEYAPGYPHDDFAAVAVFLGQTRARLAVVALDDVLGEIEQINIPGTTDLHPNWRRRVGVSVEDLPDNKDLSRVAEAFAKTGRSIAC
jgi:4-alpha-glucanotransferase